MSEKRFKESKVFWGVLAIFVVLPLISLISLQETSLSGKAVQSISYLKAGNKLFLEVNVDGVKDLTVTLLSDVKNAKITTAEVKKVSWNFKGTVYSRFKVSSADADKFGEMKFTLKIKEADLKKKGLTKKEVKLYLDGKKLTTTLKYKAGDYLFYEAASPKMGEFVIGKASK